MKKYLLKMTAFILIVASTMIVNVTAPGCAADRNLIYSGTYADLIEIEDQKIPLSSGEVQVKKVDTETGLPAAASMTQVGVFGGRQCSTLPTMWQMDSPTWMRNPRHRTTRLSQRELTMTSSVQRWLIIPTR